MRNYFLWPYRDEKRLRTNLDIGIVDLNEKVPGFARMKAGDKIFFSLHFGKYVASATINSSPFEQKNPMDQEYNLAMKLTNIKWILPIIDSGRSPNSVTIVPEELLSPEWL